MNIQDKILYFEYTQFKLLRWYSEKNGSIENNDLSVLKSLKLLFFVAAAKAHKGSENSLVDTVFNKFVAMPYGPVESEIYDQIKLRNGVLNHFEITNSTTNLNFVWGTNPFNNANLQPGIVDNIDASIDYLKVINNDFINISAMRLVDLSHLWYSWRKNYKMANSVGYKSTEIPTADIKSEIKVFKMAV